MRERMGSRLCRVCPCTQVIGRNALVSPWDARMRDCTRLTALPESSRAGNGRPLIFTSASGAPAERSQCTIQPVSHVHTGGVGTGSSLGAGAAGLITGRRVPSGARRSWTTLRGNGGARSPASQHSPVLGSIRQLHGLYEFGNGGGVPHPDSLAVSPRESTEESVDDDALRYLGSCGLPIQQPMLSETG